MNTLLKIPYLRLKYKFFPNKAQKFWAQELLDSQGLGAKLGQVLAQGKQASLPKTTIEEKEVQRWFYETFKTSALSEGQTLAASIGQVFKLRVGDDILAVKLLHPGIKEKLKSEIQNILVLGKFFAKTKGFNFDASVFERFLTEVFEEETDLRREAHFQKQFHALFSTDPRFVIPGVKTEWSNEDFLSQEWIDSKLALDLERFPNFDVFDFFFCALLRHGLLHGDLNDRNWGFTEDQRVVVFDYGCTQMISERRINGMKKLILNRDVVQAFREFGIRLEATWFKGREQELRDALFAPLSMSALKPDWSYKETLEKAFGDKTKILREFTDPWVLLMLRSLFSLIRIYQARRISIPLRDLIAPYLTIKDDPEKKVQVHIEISEDGKQSFYLNLPYSSLRTLEQSIPSKVLVHMEAQGVVLKDCVEQALKNGAVEQEMIDLFIHGRRHRVWVS
jgi:hypothetical protein